MSRKSKLALPPGVTLDWDNPDHKRHIEDEAFASVPWLERGRPTMKTPERGHLWWVWRFYGFFFYTPLRTVAQRLFRNNFNRDWPSFIYRLLFADYNCPHCGFQDYGDEHEVWSEDNALLRRVDLFELVEGGGLDYWGEAENCYGWLWCYRCGAVSWETI